MTFCAFSFEDSLAGKVIKWEISGAVKKKKNKPIVSWYPCCERCTSAWGKKSIERVVFVILLFSLLLVIHYFFCKASPAGHFLLFKNTGLVPQGGVLGSCLCVGAFDCLSARNRDGEEGLDGVWSEGCWVTPGCDGDTATEDLNVSFEKPQWSPSSVQVSLTEQTHVQTHMHKSSVSLLPCLCLRGGLSLSRSVICEVDEAKILSYILPSIRGVVQCVRESVLSAVFSLRSWQM